MVHVTYNNNVNSRDVWNEIIAEYYDYEDRPRFEANDDGDLEARMRQECAEALAEEYPAFDVADGDGDGDTDDADDADDADTDEDEDADADEEADEDSDEDDGEE